MRWGLGGGKKKKKKVAAFLQKQKAMVEDLVLHKVLKKTSTDEIERDRRSYSKKTPKQNKKQAHKLSRALHFNWMQHPESDDDQITAKVTPSPRLQPHCH